ncbi:hypothetical protein MPOCJGCO_3122 [Methylobacterium trifolii]|uniref:Resolvase/invertase-type recombinase catalytic domain-containing protein n=1 Tax=Methylobacterium trifolii TaxID=1003092 RepID=A0ABQ4U0I9_9HYPH|nr:hypothetical protein MPOCJGCO_3122 [Methylobacterium trifolii]
MLVGYARVSTQDQNLDLQRDALTKAGCERLFEEKKSGKAGTRRPAFDEALAARKTPFHNAFASRLTRIMAAARTKKASAEDGVASWSRASLRQRAIHPKVRSMTQRLGWTAKPAGPPPVR